MTSINEMREVDATVDEVWDVVADVDNDLEYWSGLSSIRNIRKEGNLIEREVLVGFMGRKGTQRILLSPRESIQLTLVSGPLIGSRVIRLSRLGARRTRIEVSWDIKLSEIPVFAQGFVRTRLEEVTREALERIAIAVESREK